MKVDYVYMLHSYTAIIFPLKVPVASICHHMWHNYCDINTWQPTHNYLI